MSELNLGPTGLQQNEDGYSVDFGGVADAKFDPVPAGFYECQIEEAEFTHAESTGNPMLKFKWTVISPDGYKGRKLFSNHVLGGSDAGMAFTKEMLKAVDASLLQGKQNFELLGNNGHFVGKRAKLKVKVKLYEGRKVNNVGTIFPAANAGAAFLG